MNRVVFLIAHPLVTRGLLEAAGTVRRLAQEWAEPGHCAFARLAGLLDKLVDEGAITPPLRDVLMEAAWRAGPDGFALEYATSFGVSLEEAMADMEAAVASEREDLDEWAALESTPLTDAECLDCGRGLRVPVGVQAVHPETVLCKRCMGQSLGLAVARLMAALR